MRTGSCAGRPPAARPTPGGQSRRLGDAAQLRGVRQRVVALDPATRRVVIGPRDGAGRDTIALRDVNWLIEPPTAPLPCEVQLRAR